MSRQRWAVAAGAVVLVALVVAFTLWRPWVPPSEGVEGCWVIDYEDLWRTNKLGPPPSACKRFKCLVPVNFEALVRGHTYQISGNELRVVFRPSVPDYEPFDERFKVEIENGEDETIFRVVELLTPPLPEGGVGGLMFGRAKYRADDVKADADGGREAGDAPEPARAMARVWAPLDPPYAFTLHVEDDTTLRSPSNILTEWLWGMKTGPLLLRRVACGKDE